MIKNICSILLILIILYFCTDSKFKDELFKKYKFLILFVILFLFLTQSNIEGYDNPVCDQIYEKVQEEVNSGSPGSSIQTLRNTVKEKINAYFNTYCTSEADVCSDYENLFSTEDGKPDRWSDFTDGIPYSSMGARNRAGRTGAVLNYMDNILQAIRSDDSICNEDSTPRSRTYLIQDGFGNISVDGVPGAPSKPTCSEGLADIQAAKDECDELDNCNAFVITNKNANPGSLRACYKNIGDTTTNPGTFIRQDNNYRFYYALEGSQASADTCASLISTATSPLQTQIDDLTTQLSDSQAAVAAAADGSASETTCGTLIQGAIQEDGTAPDWIQTSCSPLITTATSPLQTQIDDLTTQLSDSQAALAAAADGEASEASCGTLIQGAIQEDGTAPDWIQTSCSPLITTATSPLQTQIDDLTTQLSDSQAAVAASAASPTTCSSFIDRAVSDRTQTLNDELNNCINAADCVGEWSVCDDTCTSTWTQTAAAVGNGTCVNEDGTPLVSGTTRQCHRGEGECPECSFEVFGRGLFCSEEAEQGLPPIDDDEGDEDEDDDEDEVEDDGDD